MLPLSRSGRVSAPWSPASCTRLLFLHRARFDFPQLSLLPIGRFHLAAPAGPPRPFTGFRFATPCEVGDILRYGCYPCLVQAESEPPGRRSSCARLLWPSPQPRYRDDFWSAGIGEIFHRFRGFPSRRFHLTVPIRCCQRPHDTAFDRLASVSPDRVLGMHATPRPPGGRVPPGRQPSSARILLCSARPITRTSLLPEPCRHSSRRFSISVARLSTSRFSGPRRPGDHFRRRHLPYAQVCILPLPMSLSRAA
jgi:hypothetical protein